MKVFISHAASDKELASRVADALDQAGLEVWNDTQILPGDNWAAKIAQAMEESQVMVLLLTPAALNSQWVNQEISYALGRQVYRVIPVIAGPPEELPQERIPWILKRFQMFSLPSGGNDAGALQELAQAVKEAFTPSPSAV